MLSYIAQGFIQGLSEFLPISSSGHLVLFQHFSGSANVEENLLTSIVLHFATLLAVLFYFRKDIIPYFTVSGWKDAARRKIAMLVILASVPTGIMGLLFKKQFESLFSSPKFVCVALFITGILLLLAEKIKQKSPRLPLSEMPYWKSLVVGFIQGLAITPGISRSGSTISASLLLGVESEESAKYSFFLMIPAVSGAVLLEMKKVYEAGLPASLDTTGLVFGFLTAAVTGFLALKLLVYIIKKQKLSFFSYYLFAVSAICFCLLQFAGK